MRATSWAVHRSRHQFGLARIGIARNASAPAIEIGGRLDPAVEALRDGLPHLSVYCCDCAEGIGQRNEIGSADGRPESSSSRTRFMRCRMRTARAARPLVAWASGRPTCVGLGRQTRVSAPFSGVSTIVSTSTRIPRRLAGLMRRRRAIKNR